MLKVPPPDLQINFALLLRQFRETFLQDALGQTVRNLQIPDLDRELAQFASMESLSTLARFGLRGELLFPTPIVLRANPKLLGYYRLLYGYSKKEFYSTKTRIAPFKSMEEKGSLSAYNEAHLQPLCESLCSAGSLLLAGIADLSPSSGLLDELTLLTLGPQLRGGANVKRGSAGIKVVFNVIQKIVGASVTNLSKTRIELLNAAGRKVVIEFAADPDINIQVEMTQEYRKLIAIEVKAGSDYSNIHNRLGEAEKSHQKARRAGYVECWTVVNVDPFDAERGFRASPSTNRFYRIADLVNETSAVYQDFRERILSLTGL